MEATIKLAQVTHDEEYKMQVEMVLEIVSDMSKQNQKISRMVDHDLAHATTQMRATMDTEVTLDAAADIRASWNLLPLSRGAMETAWEHQQGEPSYDKE